MAGASYTLTEVARRLDVPQHRLIHLCEKGVVIPEVHAASGRGSSRVFSTANYLELAVALRLRDMFIPVSTLRGIIHVLGRFGHEIAQVRPGKTMVEHLRDKSSPELRIILSDGHALFFALEGRASAVQLFGGIPLESLSGRTIAPIGSEEPGVAAAVRSEKPRAFGGPEGSVFARLELNVNAVARSLQLD